ncbi:MAG: hypothetical protein M3Y27_18770, partial [Acidobacteriota bacterium]|nr:hypothetical protein [Acidobacteriota bacterium]
MQPAVPLKTITDGPLEGSPLSTAIVMHDGSPAIGGELVLRQFAEHTHFPLVSFPFDELFSVSLPGQQ